MKKIFIVCLVIFFLLPQDYLFAQALEQPLGIQYDALLEYFLNKVKKQDYAGAYEIMDKSFTKTNSLDSFKNLLTVTGLADFTSRQWTQFEKSADGIESVLKGQFTAGDQAPHVLIFNLALKADGLIVIKNILESMTFEDLGKKIPDNEKLLEMINADVKNITFFIKKNKAVKTYKYLSNAARKRTKVSAIMKAFAFFKKQKLNLSLPDNAVISIDEGFPKLNDAGLMIVQGGYKNDINNVKFTLAYDYEWAWKLGVFSLNSEPVSK